MRKALGTVAGALGRQGRQRQHRGVGAPDEEYTWPDQTLTVEKVRELLPEVADLTAPLRASCNLRGELRD